MSHIKKSTIELASPVVSSDAVSVSVQPLALNLQDAARAIGVPRWTLREAVMLGTLRAKRAGRSHVVLLSDLHRWLDSLDDVEPSNAPSILARRTGQ
jgi:hypothetical protein